MKKSNGLIRYQLTKIQLLLLWLKNYEFGESLIDITRWVKFYALDESINRLIMNSQKCGDENFRFKLNLSLDEEDSLCTYLLERKDFVIRYIIDRKSFEPYTHLYQLYLQYLPYELDEIEKNIFLEGYFLMLSDLYGKDYRKDKVRVQKKLNMEG